MNKRIILASVVLVAFSVVAMGQPPSVTTTTWNAAGQITINSTVSDDFISNFDMFSASQVTGTHTLTDYENNPYGYGVKTVLAQIEANVAGSGYLEFQNTRTDSKESMYGPAGETSYSYIETSDTASIQFQTRGAYAELQSCNHGFHANDHFMASGNFIVYHELSESSVGTDERAWFQNVGTGTTDIDFMSESTWGKTGSISFGKGCGCYTNCDIVATGSGTFTLGAVAENLIQTAAVSFDVMGDGTLGSATLSVGATYGTGFSCSDFSLNLN